MFSEVPDKYFLVSATSEGYTLLNAFDGALLAAGIGNVNLIRISSILPPAADKVLPFSPPPGALVSIAYASIGSQHPGETIAAAVAAATPEDPTKNGLIMEYSHQGTKDSAIEIVVKMCEKGMEARGWRIGKIHTAASETKIIDKAVAFAGVVLWR